MFDVHLAEHDCNSNANNHDSYSNCDGRHDCDHRDNMGVDSSRKDVYKHCNKRVHCSEHNNSPSLNHDRLSPHNNMDQTSIGDKMDFPVDNKAELLFGCKDFDPPMIG